MTEGVYPVAQVRAAEQALMAALPDGELMQRAAQGLLVECVGALNDRDGVIGAHVVALIGTGNNGGDALWAATGLLDRGAQVSAIQLGATIHAAAAEAFGRAGGRIMDTESVDPLAGLTGIDLVIDGIIGIGGSGAVRDPALRWVRAAQASGAYVVAVDVPSGVDADTGAIADRQAVVTADLTVTFGCMKPGLVVAPGCEVTGRVVVIDIGLGDYLPEPQIRMLGPDDCAEWVGPPALNDYKYSRGVAGVVAGSTRYRGAAFLCTAGARAGTAGMVRLLDRGDGIADAVVDRFWDVVTAEEIADPRVTGWAIGPGLGTDHTAEELLCEVLSQPLPVVVDADALRLLTDPQSRPRQLLRTRAARADVTVLTPHEGELAGLGYSSASLSADRIQVAQRAAEDLGCIVVVKGPGTLIADNSGAVFVDVHGGPALATAGSGDVLTGVMGSLLAGGFASSTRRRSEWNPATASQIVAVAVAVHGIAGQIAGTGGLPVTAQDIALALPQAVASLRDVQ